MEMNQPTPYLCKIKSGETVQVFFTDQSTGSSDQVKTTCSVETQTDDDMCRNSSNKISTSTSTETDLSSVGDRKTLETLLRWALQICTSENSPEIGNQKGDVGEAYTEAFSDSSISSFKNNSSTRTGEAVSRIVSSKTNRRSLLGKRRDSPNVLITEVRSLGHSEPQLTEVININRTGSSHTQDGSMLTLEEICNETSNRPPVDEEMDVDTERCTERHESSPEVSHSYVDLNSLSCQLAGRSAFTSSQTFPHSEGSNEGFNIPPRGGSEIHTQDAGISQQGSDFNTHTSGVAVGIQGGAVPPAQALQQHRLQGHSMVLPNERRFGESVNVGRAHAERRMIFSHDLTKRTCPICNKGFVHLKRHILVHTKEKPFECPVCGRRFARKDKLKRHCQALHTDKGQPRCLQCDRAFDSEERLKNHLETFGHASNAPGTSTSNEHLETFGRVSNAPGTSTSSEGLETFGHASNAPGTSTSNEHLETFGHASNAPGTSTSNEHLETFGRVSNAPGTNTSNERLETFGHVPNASETSTSSERLETFGHVPNASETSTSNERLETFGHVSNAGTSTSNKRLETFGHVSGTSGTGTSNERLETSRHASETSTSSERLEAFGHVSNASGTSTSNNRSLVASQYLAHTQLSQLSVSENSETSAENMRQKEAE